MKSFIKAGDKFGRWTVLEVVREAPPSYRRKGVVRCECGTVKKIRAEQLTGGLSQSCGCLSADIARVGNSTHGHSRGYAVTPIFRTYRNMLNRCYTPSSSRYANYGGRGIAVCERWRSGDGERSGFECFVADMGEKPPGASIDRINVDGNYCPENCRWLSMAAQAGNRTTNRIVTYRGEQMTLTAALRKAKMYPTTFRTRIASGMTDTDALEKPVMWRGPANSSDTERPRSHQQTPAHDLPES